MKKALFLDRDGTIILEPQDDFQIDSLEKLAFLPGAITALRKIAEETDYELVMVTNQDGLGTGAFPEATFWPAHRKMLDILAGENIHFSNVLIDRSFPHEHLPTRKPGTGLLTAYLNGDYDLKNSYVVGDRLTDVLLAQNLGTRAILVNPPNKPSELPSLPPDCESLLALCTGDWEAIYRKLRPGDRTATVLRHTKETRISIELNLDGRGQADIHTGLGFFDHMLDQLARHGGLDLNIEVAGDLHIDEHHTIEDTALALGEAFQQALADKRGISRYGFLLPMDEALAQVAIDFSGRPWLVWQADFQREKIGDMPTEMFYHFFKSFSDAARCNLNMQVQGQNEHHKIEALFKAWAKAIKMAVARNLHELDLLPSTKGVL